MSRKGAAKKREVYVDPVYNSKLVTHLVNKVMFDGKKSIAQGIVYGALNKAHVKLAIPAVEILDKVMEQVMPVLEVKARRVGGATYQVPVEVRATRRQALGVRWLIDYSRKRSERTMIEKLSAEIVDAFSGTGAAVKKREDVHKMAEANKAFAHYRW